MLKNPIFKSTILQVLQAVTQSRHLREDAEVCKQLDQIGVATQLTDETFESNRSAHGNGRMDLSDDEADEKNADEERPSAAKRRRLDLPSIWSCFVSHFACLRLSPEVAPWLQVVDDALKLHSAGFSKMVSLPLYVMFRSCDYVGVSTR